MPVVDEAVITRLKEGMSRQVAGDFRAAEAIYTEVLAADPDNADANHLLGLVRAEEDQTAEAVRLIEKALSIKDDAAPFHHNIAGIYRRIGRLADAEREFRRAIELKPDYGEAYQGLAEMVKFERGDDFIQRALAQLSQPHLPTRVRCYFHFAAGKYLDDIGEYRAAFEHYRRGNEAAERPFDSLAFRQQVKDCLYVFGPDFVRARLGLGDPTQQPVFIVGMPRSGTSLVEQIIASHSRAWGAGELNDMKMTARLARQLSVVKQPYPDCVAGLAPPAFERLARDYLTRVGHVVPKGYDRVIDKHPMNFQLVGLILLMYPNARVIHTVRDPLDTCLSCFFQNFTKGQNYSFDLQALAHFYNDYRRLMAHWENVFPGRILRVVYEDVLADQQAQTERLLEFCGLDFEPACLSFFETKRDVKTASFRQVRQPIYHSSVNRWRKYASEMTEVAQILGIPVETPVTLTGRSSLL